MILLCHAFLCYIVTNISILQMEIDPPSKTSQATPQTANRATSQAANRAISQTPATTQVPFKGSGISSRDQ